MVVYNCSWVVSLSSKIRAVTGSVLKLTPNEWELSWPLVWPRSDFFAWEKDSKVKEGLLRMIAFQTLRFLQIIETLKSAIFQPLPFLRAPSEETSHYGKNQLFIQKLPRIWCLKNVKFVKNETFKLWILSKMRLWKCEFCEKCDFENVNFVKNATLKLWILWKMPFWKCEFCQKCDFENVNFVKNKIFKMWIFG